MPSTRLDGDVYVDGNLQATTLTLPLGTVANAGVAAAAGIAATKLEHQHQLTYAQASGDAAADDTRVIHVVRGATGDVVSFSAGSVDKAVGNSVVTIDLLKNGSSILTAVITLNAAKAGYEVVDALVASAALVADDVLEIVVDATIGTGTLPKGMFVVLALREDAAL